MTMVGMVEMTNIMLMGATATRIFIMMRITTLAKPAETVVAMPGAADEKVCAFVEPGPTAVFPNVAEYLARHGGRANVMVRRDVVDEI